MPEALEAAADAFLNVCERWNVTLFLCDAQVQNQDGLYEAIPLSLPEDEAGKRQTARPAHMCRYWVQNVHTSSAIAMAKTRSTCPPTRRCAGYLHRRSLMDERGKDARARDRTIDTTTRGRKTAELHQTARRSPLVALDGP